MNKSALKRQESERTIRKAEKRAKRKAYKKQQKRMELTTKSKYPMPSRVKAGAGQMAKEAKKQIEMLRLQNHALTKKIAALKQAQKAA